MLQNKIKSKGTDVKVRPISPILVLKPSLHQFWNPLDQSQLRITWFKAMIGPRDSKICTGKSKQVKFSP